MDVEDDMREASRIRSAVANALQQGIELVFPGDFIQLQVSLGNKYVKLDLEDLIKKNAKAHGWGERLDHALAQLYSLGRELMKPTAERSDMWDYISFADITYLDILKDIEGHIHILQLFGYRADEDAFTFEEEPTVCIEKVELTAELYLAEAELTCYLSGSHPFGNLFDCLVPPQFQKPNGPQEKSFGKVEIPTPEVQGNIPEKLKWIDIRDPNVYEQNGAHQRMSASDVADQCACEPNGLESFVLVPNVPGPPVPELNIKEPYAKEQADALCLLATKSDVPQSRSQECAVSDQDINKEEESLTESLGTELRCHHCQFINLPDAELCISCAEPLDHPAPPDHDVNQVMNGFSTEKGPEEKRCPTCTFMNPGTTNICLMCYFSLTDNAYRERQDSNSFLSAGNDNAGLAEKNEGMMPSDVQRSSNDPKPPGTASEAEAKSKPDQDYIRCPKCGSACESALGAFGERKCISCPLSFCDGCKGPFEMECQKYEECPRDPHCHHPRDCLFYVNQCSLDLIRTFLDERDIKYDKYNDWLAKVAEYHGCNQEVMKREHKSKENNRLCHPYKEYMVWLMKDHRLDPAPVMTDDQLIYVIKHEYGEDPTHYEYARLQELVKTMYPLPSTQ